MLTLPLLRHDDLEAVARTFHRDGFVAITGVLSSDELERLQVVATEEMEKVMATRPPGDGHYGQGHYSFKEHFDHPAWIGLLIQPRILRLIEAIYGSDAFTAGSGAGVFALPGSGRQALHADVRDWLRDPLGQSTVWDLPTSEVNVNVLMVDFTERNGATRYIPCTHRTRVSPPSLEDEPDWMRSSFAPLPAGTVVIRDLRLWHAGGQNDADSSRVMLGLTYRAPWYVVPPKKERFSLEFYAKLPERAKRLMRPLIVF